MFCTVNCVALTSEDNEKLKGDVSKVIKLLEQDCFIWLCNITTHLVRNMV